MAITVRRETSAALSEYAGIPSTLDVSHVLDATAGLDGIRLTLRAVAAPYIKDYDRDTGFGPRQWPERFDLTRWGIWIAREEGRCVGGAAVAVNTSELESRKDVAVLWDLRVALGVRRRWIATQLFISAEAWARGEGAAWLKIETQNVNLPACRFYLRQGCTLGAVHRFAYPALLAEIQLLWYKKLIDCTS